MAIENLTSEQVRRINAKLLPWIRKMTRDVDRADDLLQEAWASALASPTVRMDGLGSYVGACARNRFINEYRTARRRYALAGAPLAMDDAHEIAADEDIEGDAVRRALAREMLRACDELGPDYEGWIARVLMGTLSYEGAARECGVAMGTIRSRVFRARVRLRKRLAGWNVEGERRGVRSADVQEMP